MRELQEQRTAPQRVLGEQALSRVRKPIVFLLLFWSSTYCCNHSLVQGRGCKKKIDQSVIITPTLCATCFGSLGLNISSSLGAKASVQRRGLPNTHIRSRELLRKPLSLLPYSSCFPRTSHSQSSW